jgi:hypothetical protein
MINMTQNLNDYDMFKNVNISKTREVDTLSTGSQKQLV